jgi:molecular chaperone GrpE (heat shock protein)
LTKGKIITEDYKLDPEEEIEIKIIKKEHKTEKTEPAKEVKVEEEKENSENDKLKTLFTQINQTIEQMKGKDIEALHTEFLPVLDNAIPYVENNHVKKSV